MKIEITRNELRSRLQELLGDRIGFELDEAAGLMRLSRKTLYNKRVGFRCGGKRLVGVEDILSTLEGIEGGKDE